MKEDEKISSIVQSFREVNRLFYKQLWQNAQTHGVTILQLHLLKLIDEEPGLGLVELADRVHVGKSTVSGTVDRLVKAGYIERKRSDTDRRALVMTLSETGKQKKEAAYADYLQHLAGLQELSESEAEALIKLHKKVISKITPNGVE